MRLIKPFEIFAGAASVDEYDERFGVRTLKPEGHMLATEIALPFDSVVLGVAVEFPELALVGTVAAVIVRCAVHENEQRTERFRFFFALDGAAWPERRYLATVQPVVLGVVGVVTDGRRYVNVFGGGVQ